MKKHGLHRCEYCDKLKKAHRFTGGHEDGRMCDDCYVERQGQSEIEIAERVRDAAPEMLALLLDCKKFFESCEDGLPPGAPMPERFEALIAKAKGERK